MTKTFSFYIPGEVVCGVGAIEELPGRLKSKNLGKVLIVTDTNITKIGLTQKVEDLLSASGVSYDIFSDVEANPSSETVDKGVSKFIESSSEGIVCLGGGSPMDTAKAIAILVANGGRIQDYEGAGKVSKKITPIVAVPTTAGTGSEVTPFAVITDRSKNFKLSIFSHEIIPELAILDPELITSMPPLVAASTGMDALTHAIESYLSLAATPFSDLMAEKAMMYIGKSIRSFVANRNDITAGSDMQLGSMFAGIAFSWSRLGNVHAMAHPLGGVFDIAHGVANAVLLPHVLEYNSLADQGKYEEIFKYVKDGKVVNGFVPSMLVEEIKLLSSQLGIPKNLSELNVQRDLIPQMAVDAMKSGNIAINPRQTTLDDVIGLYEGAM